MAESRISNIQSQIIDCLRLILKRSEEAGERLSLPGEGGERRFRYWLATDFLHELLGWPNEKIVVGERFDILLRDADGLPVVTIETKTPYHKATKKERETFEKRLSGFGTLRTAYFTNGAEWERLDILAPTGELEIRERFDLNLDATDHEEAQAFFAPLFVDRHITGSHRSGHLAVGRENPHILEALAADLDRAIGDAAFVLRSLFDGLRVGEAGEEVYGLTVSLFDLWCEKSLVVSPRQSAQRLTTRLRTEDLTSREITKALADMGLKGKSATEIAEDLSSLPKPQRQNVDSILEVIWPAYEQHIDNLCAQTSHVILARTLLYRVGEDQNVFSRILSGEPLEDKLTSRIPGVLRVPHPATDLLNRVRDSMQDFLPSVYKLGEFDWWLVTPEKRGVLRREERVWLRQMDSEFERSMQRLLRMLDGYFFGRVDVDVWRNVYQHYLPPEERRKLGGFYTPDELVHLVF